jgi:ribonuclease HI
MWSIRIGRESEGSNSKRPELAALASVLRAVQVQSPLLYLCDNEAVLRDVARWIGEGHKASMSTNKDADILTNIIQRLHLRVAAGAATFLLKFKSHRGEVLNEMADVAAENGRGKDDDGGTFTKASGKLVLSVEKDGKLMQSTWTKGIQAAIRWQGGQHIVRQWQRQGAKVWVQRRLRRSTQPWLQPTAREKEMFSRKDFVTNEDWEQRCLSNLFEEEPGKKVLDTWCEDFLMQRNASREVMTKWLANKYVPWKRKRRLLQAITLSFPSSAWLHKIGAAESDKCTESSSATRQ